MKTKGQFSHITKNKVVDTFFIYFANNFVHEQFERPGEGKKTKKKRM